LGQLSWEPSLSAVWIDQGDRVHYVIMAWMTNHHSCIVCNEYTCPSSTLEPTLRDTWSPLITGQYGTTPSRYRILPFDAYNPAVPHQHLSDLSIFRKRTHIFHPENLDIPRLCPPPTLLLLILHDLDRRPSKRLHSAATGQFHRALANIVSLSSSEWTKETYRDDVGREESLDVLLRALVSLGFTIFILMPIHPSISNTISDSQQAG